MLHCTTLQQAKFNYLIIYIQYFINLIFMILSETGRAAV